MSRRPVGVAVRCLFLAACLPGAAAGAEPAPMPREVPAPGGPRLTVAAPAVIRYGQHLDAVLTDEKDSEAPPYVRFVWAGPGRTVHLELLTDAGEVVPTVPEVGATSSGLSVNSADVRLRPSGPHARAACLAPGRYRLRAVVEARKDPFDPIAWVGRIEARPVAFTVPADGSGPLTADAARRLVTDLAAPDPAVRLAAVRRAVPTDNGEVLVALVERLADPHEISVGFSAPDRWFRWPVANAARRDALPAQGPAVIGPLLAFAARPANVSYREAVAELLGRLGPDPRSLAFTRALLATGTQDERMRAVETLGRLGADAVPDLIRTARDEKQHPFVRRNAIEELGKHGTAESAGPFLREALGYRDWHYVSAAARAVESVGDRAALPVLRRIAEGADDHGAPAAAIQAYAVLAPRPDARAFLLKLLSAKSTWARGDAVYLLAGVGTADDVPRVMEMLSDPEWYVRAQADGALRGLAGKPEGVGAVPSLSEATADQWRAWWRARR